jgi:hypothetical protein
MMTITSRLNSAEIVIASQNPSQKAFIKGSPDIPYQWAVDALQDCDVPNVTTGFGSATTNESAEFQYLSSWPASSSSTLKSTGQ